MAKSRRIILILLIIVFILIIIVTCAILTNKKEDVYYIEQIDEEGDVEQPNDSIDTSLQIVTIRNDYYAVKECTEKFYKYYSRIFNEENSQTNNKEYIYNMLDEEYITYKNISKDNIENKIDKINNSIINIDNMYISKKNENISLYIVEGKLREIETNSISDFRLMVKLDEINDTFKVFLNDYIDEKIGNIEVGKELNINVDDSVNNDSINTYEYKLIDDEIYVKDLFSKYNHLDEEYKKKRFNNFNEFKLYFMNNRDRNSMIELTKYQKNSYDDYKEFVCLDQYGNYYIFNETSVMNYKLILDTHTVDIPYFTEKYNKGNEQIKVGMNIEKVIDAINSKDYDYIYEKLDINFKNNQFGSMDRFTNYMSDNFFDSNKANYKQFSKKGDVYVYEIKITPLEEENQNYKDVTIIMKLLEDNNFVMSFSIN